jgi:hypothetical protein
LDGQQNAGTVGVNDGEWPRFTGKISRIIFSANGGHGLALCRVSIHGSK